MTRSRRQFLRSALAAAGGVMASPRAPVLAAQGASPRAAARPVKPPRLKPGDIVGLVDPSSATWEPMEIDVIVESLAALGLTAKLGANLLKRRGYFAGTDAERAADVNAMFADPDVRWVHCVRGGWGAARVLPLLDWKTIAGSAKILAGFSDITALVLAVYAKTGLVTFHGPNGSSQWNAFNVGWIRRVLMEAEAVTFENLKDPGDNLAVVENRTRTITPGRARGRLLGGNLSIVTSLVGTGYLPDFDGAILFLEDVSEAPYRIDRMFTQLKHAGILDRVRAVVWGTCSKCDPGEGFGSLTIADVLNDHVKPLGVPAWQGAMIGHIDRQFLLPLGVEVEVDATAATIRMLEPAVL